MHFGLYLVKNNIIDSDEFVDALEQQIRSRPQLGGLAIETGKLSVKQVFDVLRAQCDAPAELFGELAVGYGYLTEDELTGLLFLQSVREKTMAEILVEKSLLTEQEVLEHLDAVRRQKQQSHDKAMELVH